LHAAQALPGFLSVLAASEPAGSADQQMHRLSSDAISYICDPCTEPLRPYLTSGATTDPPPSDVRAAVCADPRCAFRFEDFITSLGVDAQDDYELERLCELGERLGNRAMAKLLAALAVKVEDNMGLSARAAASALRLAPPARLAHAHAGGSEGGGSSPPPLLASALVVSAGLAVAAVARASHRGGRWHYDARRTGSTLV
jgi:hypothetical protein